jgi:hypothetical protein
VSNLIKSFYICYAVGFFFFFVELNLIKWVFQDGSPRSKQKKKGLMKLYMYPYTMLTSRFWIACAPFRMHPSKLILVTNGHYFSRNSTYCSSLILQRMNSYLHGICTFIYELYIFTGVICVQILSSSSVVGFEFSFTVKGT